MPAIFGIGNHTLNLAVGLGLVVAAVFWLALIWWTFADARRRISDGLLVACAVIASFFPLIGTLIYMIVRPPEYLADVRERDLEIRAAEARLQQADVHPCPHCSSPVEKDFLRCPACMRKLKSSCHNCRRALDPVWAICPYCEAEVPGAIAPSPRTTTRRRRPARAVADPAQPGSDF